MSGSQYTPAGRLRAAPCLSGAAFALVVSAGLGGCNFTVQPSTSLSGDDFLQTGRTLSHFTAIQVDPPSEDSAGPQFVVAEDLNGDGTLDLVSAWNQSQPVQIHLQHRDGGGAIRFETVILAGNVPVVSVAGLAVADFDNDGRMDIAVLVKDTATGEGACLDSELPEPELSGRILIYFGPSDPAQANQALAWREVPVGNSFLQGTGEISSRPEDGGFTSLTTGDIDANGTMDLLVAWNSTCAGGRADALVFSNPGPSQVRDGTWVAFLIPDDVVKGGPVKDAALADIDRDGDLDVVATFPNAPAMNVRWYRNPTIDVADDVHVSNGQWQVGTIGQLPLGADIAALGDLDRDGIVDVVVRSANGRIVQWFKGPPQPSTLPVRNIPWQVYTLAEFTERTPEAIAIGDLNFDGQLEVILSAEGGLAWFDSQGAPTVYDQWIERLIVDDIAPKPVGDNPATTDPNVEPEEITGATSINSVLVADLDGDGASDLIGTFDRMGLSGLSNDALVWFRNTRRR